MTTWYVYIIQSGTHKNSPIKIGVSQEPEIRITNLQTGNPYLLTLKAKIPLDSKEMAYYVENKLHRYLYRHKLEGEWFKGGRVSLKPILTRIMQECTVEQDLKLEKAFAVGNNSDKALIESLKNENKKLRRKIKKLERDIEDYLDAEAPNLV